MDCVCVCPLVQASGKEDVYVDSEQLEKVAAIHSELVAKASTKLPAALQVRPTHRCLGVVWVWL
jgi:hypothetical protein